MKSTLRVISYVRDLSVEEDKFIEFDRMLGESKGLADAVLVASPQVLGDTFSELVTNLDKLANAGLMLIIVPPDERMLKQQLN